MIERWQTSRLSAMMKVRRGVNLTGARQSGKTTLAEMVFAENIAKTPFTGIVLYSGNKTLRFGNGFYAVPLAALGA